VEAAGLGSTGDAITAFVTECLVRFAAGVERLERLPADRLTPIVCCGFGISGCVAILTATLFKIKRSHRKEAFASLELKFVV
jgi:hypothetical protein